MTLILINVENGKKSGDVICERHQEIRICTLYIFKSASLVFFATELKNIV